MIYIKYKNLNQFTKGSLPDGNEVKKRALELQKFFLQVTTSHRRSICQYEQEI